MSKLITYSEVLAKGGIEIHQAYYEQYITPQADALIRKHLKLEVLQSSNDPYFNDVYSCAEVWDRLAKHSIIPVAKMRANGETNVNTISVAVCILKAAARKWVADSTNS